MLSKTYESTKIDRRTWLHVPSGTLWSTSSGTHQVSEVVEMLKGIKMYTPFSIDFINNMDHKGYITLISDS